MIYLKLEGHDFRYEAEDVIELFYNKEEIVYFETEPPEEFRGIFLLSRVIQVGSGLTIHTVLKFEGVCYNENERVLEAESSDEHAVLKMLKREVKHQIFNALADFTGIQPPWGTLTGIRPSKIIHEMLEHGNNRNEILGRLNGYYRVSEQKARLLYDIAITERNILDSSDPRSVSLYIGIPFCTTRCLYCSFTSNPIDKYRHLIGKYLDALKTEIEAVAEIIRNNSFKIQSIYIGGGTPTSMDSAALKVLLNFIESSFDLDALEEYTLEAGRPDSIDVDKLVTIKNSKVSRISINPQTMNNETLNLIGRNHTSQDIINAFKLARRMGFDNINTDIIMGLPGENAVMFENTLRAISELSPESLTVHSLAIKRASRLKEERGNFDLASGIEANTMIDLAQKYAESMGMHPYYLYRQKNMLGNLENTGYCKPGFESIYNIQIMEERQSIIALGAGAITKVVYHGENRIERAFNVKSVEEYVGRVQEMIERKRELFL